MLYVTLPEEKTRKVSFFLAMEEYVARHAGARDYMFYWQVGPSVVCGRNQLVRNEVDLDYCREHGIGVFRRKSGGGCVYADMGNVMFSFVTGGDDVAETFGRYVALAAEALKGMGVNAAPDGRNDIIVDGGKVSGSAFYRLGGRNIVHGTMLYDADMENMVHCLTPPGEKLESKGVDSVRHRVALLKDYTDIGVEGLKAGLREALCDGVYALGADDVAEIERIEHSVYLSPGFILGGDPVHSLVHSRRIQGVGTVEARMEIKGESIRNVSLDGDFFAVGDVDAMLASLKGVRLDRDAIAAALPHGVGDVIMNLGKDDLVALLAGVDGINREKTENKTVHNDK